MLRAATRGSPLARLQTDLVAAMLRIEFEQVVLETGGDRRRELPIWAIGGKGVFVKEVQAAVLDGRADLAVHSAKDLPSTQADGLVLAAVPERGDPRDAMVGCSVEGLPVGGRVGTGSARRRAQLAWHRPDLTFADLRGNIDTRLAKAADLHAVVVAAAALRRLGRSEVITQVLDPRQVVPQVAQGALAVECRADDERTRHLLGAIDHPASRRAVDTERAWLAEVGGDCDLPVGAYATVAAADGAIHLSAVIATLDGRILLRADDEGDDPTELGRRLARFLLDDRGAASLTDGLAAAPASSRLELQ